MSGYITCKETGEEYGYSSYEQREFIIAGIVEDGCTWSDTPIQVGFYDCDYDY